MSEIEAANDVIGGIKLVGAIVSHPEIHHLRDLLILDYQQTATDQSANGDDPVSLHVPRVSLFSRQTLVVSAPRSSLPRRRSRRTISPAKMLNRRSAHGAEGSGRVRTRDA